MPGQMLFGFRYFSNAGKTTHGRLIAAQTRDPLADPCYVPKPRETRVREEEDVSVNVTTGPLADLQQALREAAEDHEKACQQESATNAVATKKVPVTWAVHQLKDPNWYFDTKTERFQSLAREVAPPPGAYMPKWSKVFPRVLGQEWQNRRHESRKHLLAKYNDADEGPKEMANLEVRQDRVTKIVDWAKQGANNKSFSDLPSAQAYKLDQDYTEPDKLLGTRPRQPCFDFNSCVPRKPAGLSSYFQPGHYKTDRAYRVRVGPKFEKCVGRDAFYRSNDNDVVDRSLARDCPYLRSIKSVPDFSKTLPRKEAAQKQFYAEDAAMNFDIDKAERAILPRAHSVANISKMLPREKAGLANRAACHDPALIRLRNGDRDISVELLPVEQIFQSMVRRQVVADFSTMLGREKSKTNMEPPTRYQDYSDYLEFERKPNDFETKALVPDFSGVAASRRSRSHKDLDSWADVMNQFDNPNAQTATIEDAENAEAAA